MQFVFLHILTHIQWHRQGGVSSVMHPVQLSRTGGKMGNKINILNGQKFDFQCSTDFQLLLQIKGNSIQMFFLFIYLF